MSLAVLLALLVASLGCARSSGQPPTWPLRATDHSPSGYWDEGVHFLQEGDTTAAQRDLDRVASLGAAALDDPALFFRDLAEARLFGGEPTGAGEAAVQATAALARRSDSAQFRATDRHLFQVEIDSLAAAAAADRTHLGAIAEEPGAPADPWYLLGWLDEQQGDRAAAQQAYRAYLDRSPQWALLRSTALMRRHAQDIADRSQ